MTESFRIMPCFLPLGSRHQSNLAWELWSPQHFLYKTSAASSWFPPASRFMVLSTHPQHTGLPGAGFGWLPRLLGTCLCTGCSRQPLIRGHRPPPEASWATRRPEAAGPVQPACLPPPRELVITRTHAPCLQTGKQALAAHMRPVSDEHHHGPEEHVLTGRRKSECDGRLWLLPSPTLNCHRTGVVVVRPGQPGVMFSPMLEHITHRQQVLFARPWFPLSVIREWFLRYL